MLNRLKLAAAFACALAFTTPAAAQSNPNLSKGQVLTAGQWNALFAGKQDTLGFIPAAVDGTTFTGRVVVPAAGATLSGFNITPGGVPGAPINGDIWITSAGVFVRVNGVTQGPLSGPSAGSFAATTPLAVTFPGGVTTYACPTCGVTTGPLSQFSSTTSAQLLGIISDETGSGALVFANAPTLVAPVLGAATATSINKVTITPPATSATLTIADGLTLAYSGKTGNTSVFATATGTLTPGDCVKVDPSGNLADSGAACGAGSNVAASQNFVAGVGFTAGTTTTLTLSSAPTNANQLLIAFDGIVQAHNTWGLAGAVVTFNAAIPANVNVVEAQWYTATTSAGVGSLTDTSGNVLSGAGIVAAPFAISGNTLNTGGACFLRSRADAITKDLSTCRVVMTGGYAKSGDGGGATFYKRTGAILTYTITNTGACNNGVWPGIRLTGGTGAGAYGTLTVAGGVATNFSIQGTNSQGIGYTALDSLTVSNAGNVSCTVYPVIRVDTVGNAPFIDAAVTGASVVNAGAGCTNGSYKNVALAATIPNGGGFGDLFSLNIDISGGAVVGTSSATPGGGYKVGDQLSTVLPNGALQIPGCTTQPVFQISTIKTAVGSFTDNAGTAWQIIKDNNTNVLQFGAVANYNWLMPDGDATDSGPAFRAALEFIQVGMGPADAHGFSGGRLYVPKGGYLICGGVIQYQYTTLQGDAFGASTLKQCNSDGATAAMITQGSPTTFSGNVASNTWDLTLYGAATGTGPVIYSNNNQSGDAISRVAIYPNVTSRTCVKYEIGYGGQSMYGIHNIWCVPQQGSPALDLSGNFGFQIDGQSMISSISTVAIGIRFGDGGVAYVGPGVHCEGAVTNCISVNGAGTSPPQVTVEGALGPATNLVRIETGTPANFTTLTNVKSNGSTCTVFMQATSTCAKSGNQLGTATY